MLGHGAESRIALRSIRATYLNDPWLEKLASARVGWVERSATHHDRRPGIPSMGYDAERLHPSYALERTAAD